MTTKLRDLTVKEWLGERRKDYERFVTISDNFDEEAQQFRRHGYFAGELGNLMPLGVSNLLKMSIAILSSLILTANLISGSSQLFLAFNSSASGHFDYVTFVPGESSTETDRHRWSKQNKICRVHAA